MQSTLLQEIGNSISPISLAVAFAAVLVTIIYYSLRSRGLPPGPIGVPFLGYLPFLNRATCHLQLDALKKKYGHVYSFSCTGQLYINLGTIKAIREAHLTKADCFTDRSTKQFSLISSVFDGAVAFANGESWKVLRKFFLQTLKERGVMFLKNSQYIDDTVNSALNDLRKANGKPVNIIKILTAKCNTVLRMTLLGDSAVSEEQLQEIVELYGIVVATTTPYNLLPVGKIARYLIFPFMSDYRKTRIHLKKLESALYKIIDQHKSTYDENNIRNIIDEYLKERNARRSKGDAAVQYFTDKVLMASLMQTIGDSVLAIGSFIAMTIKVLLDNPGEQQKIYEELVEVVGPDRDPTLDDRSKLTYLNAFILEATRKSDFFPFFPTLECTKETTIHGYRIPKGAITVQNFLSAHSDPDTYDEPEKFLPARYITTPGTRRPELPVSFGVGRRACIGEGFTMMQTFLFLSTIVKNFRLTLPGDVTTPDFELLLSGNLDICAHPRIKK